jgi:hypothetical protein
MNVDLIKFDLENIIQHLTNLCDSVDFITSKNTSEIELKEKLKESANTILADAVILNDQLYTIQNCVSDEDLRLLLDE